MRQVRARVRKPGIEVLFDAASAGGQHNRRTVAECWLETEGRARAARRARSLTQQDAAESIGVSAEFYGRIERGRTLPSVPTLVRIAEALDIPTDASVGRTGSQGVASPLKPNPGSRAMPRELRNLLRRLRRVPPRTLRLLGALVAELEAR